MSSATTYFANRVRLSALNTWTGATLTLTNNSTTFSGTGPTTGDYIWLAADGVWNACRVSGANTLAYVYRGAGGASQAGYYCTPETISVLRGLDFNASWQVEELYGTDSIFRVDEARHNFSVEVNIKYSKWDPAVASDWGMSLLNPTTRDGTVKDTNTVYINGLVYSISGSTTGTGQTIELVCGRTYFDGLPFPFPENDFIVRDLKGKASSIVMHNY